MKKIGFILKIHQNKYIIIRYPFLLLKFLAN